MQEEKDDLRCEISSISTVRSDRAKLQFKRDDPRSKKSITKSGVPNALAARQKRFEAQLRRGSEGLQGVRLAKSRPRRVLSLCGQAHTPTEMVGRGHSRLQTRSRLDPRERFQGTRATTPGANYTKRVANRRRLPRQKEAAVGDGQNEPRHRAEPR